jgi:hypothetical protein
MFMLCASTNEQKALYKAKLKNLFQSPTKHFEECVKELVPHKSTLSQFPT